MSIADRLPLPVSGNSGDGTLTTGMRGETVDARVLVLLRCVLAFSGLAVAWGDPTVVTGSSALIYGPLVIYCVFGVVVAYNSRKSGWSAPPRVIHWVDVCIFAYLVGVSGRSNGFFVLFFFYPILVSSFCWGFKEGLLLTFVSTVLFLAVEMAFLSAGNKFEEGRTLIHAAYLGIFGYLISYLGDYERTLRRKLALLKEINNPGNPRFGADHVKGGNLDRLVDFYQGESCVLMVRRPSPAPHYVMYFASPKKPGHLAMPSSVGESEAEALLRLPDSLAAYYHDPDGPVWRRWRGYSAYDFDLGAKTKTFEADCAAWANLLDTHAFITAPYSQRDGTTGRIFLTRDLGGFSHVDIEFLAQTSDAIATVAENMLLVEELITGAAERERLAISRDLHDTTIQPYIGLKLALDGLYREAGDTNPLSSRIADLVEMTELTVRDLRSYATTLKEKTPMAGEFLVAAVQKQAERLERFYGIKVKVKSDISPRLSGRMAAEAFQMIAEGLSNTLRHTTAKYAFVTILCENSNLLLEIGNEGGEGVKHFLPRSISERSNLLGGNTVVEHRPDGYTVVHITIPM